MNTIPAIFTTRTISNEHITTPRHIRCQLQTKPVTEWMMEADELSSPHTDVLDPVSYAITSLGAILPV